MCIKTVAERQDRRNFKARALFVYENALVFSKTEARNFFMYIIMVRTEACVKGVSFWLLTGEFVPYLNADRWTHL